MMKTGPPLSEVHYVLYSGAGNTFALITEPISSQDAVKLCEMCSVDGVIFQQETFHMRIFNRDGSEAEMCGNGLRCFVKFLVDNNIHRERYTIQTLAGSHTAWLNGDQVCVQLPPPYDYRQNLIIEKYTVHHLNTGVPHAVIFVDSVNEIDLSKLGPLIRHHALFPEGTNVNIVDPLLRIRTYERGVEAETLACGTGTTASALIAGKIFNLPSPIYMNVQSGDKLKISFTPDWKTVTMEGPAGRLDFNHGSPILCPL